MTANYADELVGMAKNRGDSLSRQLADLLRQQQVEMETLKNKHEFLSGYAQQGDIMIDELRELQTLVKSFFEDYLNYEEESDSGRVFCPIHLSCTRVMMIEPLAELLKRMKELSGVEK